MTNPDRESNRHVAQMIRSCLLAPVVVILCPAVGLGQTVNASDPDSTNQSSISLFLDCSRCDEDFTRRQIPYVNYARDRLDADIHLLITSQRAGSGREFAMYFIGRQRFEGVDDTLTVMSSDTDTDDERRSAITHYIELGLVRYLARTSMSGRIEITVDSTAVSEIAVAGVDKWNYWSFRIATNGNVKAESATNSFRIGGRLNADRITDAWKIRMSARANYSEENFDLGDEGTVTSVLRNGSANAMVIKSLGSHWSVGGFSSFTTSSFNNTTLKASLAPAVEYNVFPYSESSRRAFTVSYFLALQSLRYDEITVFDETDQILIQQRLEANLEFEQPWGEASASFSVSNYITDFSKNLSDLYGIQLSGYAEIRIVRGLSVFGWGNVSRIRDQIFLPKEEASEEDILLGTVQLPTDFSFSTSIGLSYRFGSIFNNIVNPRFGI